MPNTTLSAHLKEIITRASAEIAAAIRGAASQPAAPAPAPSKPAARKAPAPKAAAPAPAAAGRKPHPRRSYTDADIERVVGIIADKPGLRSEEIKAAAGGDARVVEKILERLRETGRVKTTGIKRAMVYNIAGRAAQSATTAPKTVVAKGKPGRKPKAAAPAPAAPAAAAAKPKRDWPQCSVPGCGKSMFGPSAERRLCYTHYQEAGGKHYSKA